MRRNGGGKAANGGGHDNYYPLGSVYEEIAAGADAAELHERRVRRRRARLVVAAEEAFAQVKKINDGRSKSEFNADVEVAQQYFCISMF